MNSDEIVHTAKNAHVQFHDEDEDESKTIRYMTVQILRNGWIRASYPYLNSEDVGKTCDYYPPWKIGAVHTSPEGTGDE